MSITSATRPTTVTTTSAATAASDVRTASAPVVRLEPGALAGVKRAYSTRRVDLDRCDVALDQFDLHPASLPPGPRARTGSRPGPAPRR